MLASEETLTAFNDILDIRQAYGRTEVNIAEFPSSCMAVLKFR
jgi:hypothetical protein